MIYKLSVGPKIPCIGMFTHEILSQFQLATKKGNVFLFFITKVDDSGITIANVLTNEAQVIPLDAITKIKDLDGNVVTCEVYVEESAVTLMPFILSNGEVSMFDASLKPVTVTGISVVKKVAAYNVTTADGIESIVSDVYSITKPLAFGK